MPSRRSRSTSAAIFGQYLDQFRLDPHAAQEILLAHYDGRAVDADQAIHTVGYYGRTQQPLATARAKEHAADVRKDLTASQKNLGELKKAHPDNKEVQEVIAKIEAIHKKVMGHCDMIDKELVKEKGDSVALCACCVDIQNDLDAAKTEMTKLRKALKIELPELIQTIVADDSRALSLPRTSLESRRGDELARASRPRYSTICTTGQNGLIKDVGARYASYVEIEEKSMRFIRCPFTAPRQIE